MPNRILCLSGHALVALWLVCPSLAGAASFSWQVSSGDWSAASNWGGTAPTISDVAYIANGGTATIQSAAAADGLTIGGTAGSGTVQINSGSLATRGLQVGYAGAGTVIQSAGRNEMNDYWNTLTLGYSSGVSGAYQLTGSGSLVVPNEYVGYSGTGTFIQSGGTNNGRSWVESRLFVGWNALSSGTYTLNGPGLLTMTYEQIGCTGTGTFLQSAGTNQPSYLYLGTSSSGNGTYALSGSGLLAAPWTEMLGFASSSTGTFTQSGGTNTIQDTLYLGYASASKATYSLSGNNSQLSAGTEYIGYVASAAALFQQNGGANTTNCVSIGSGGRYLLAGGTLQVGSGGIANAGVFDGGGGTAVLNANCILDLTAGTWQNVGALTVNMGPGTLLIVPPTFGGFGTYTTLGLTHTAGTTLEVPAGQGFIGAASFTDLVSCSGTVTAASGGAINLKNGLWLSGTGNVALGSGTLTVNDAVSGIGGGSLSASSQYVGTSGSGLFTQLGGVSTLSGTMSLCLGFSGGSGTYALNGPGQLSATGQYVGYSGTGAFSQSAGTNQGQYLYLAYSSGCSGSYTLSGSGLLAMTNQVCVGSSGTGTFTQSGGTNNVGGLLRLGLSSSSVGTYNLIGPGLLTAPSEELGMGGTGYFYHSGGTNSTPALKLGTGVIGKGSYTLSNSGVLTGTNEYIGYAGQYGTNIAGIFNQSGGTNSASALYLGYAALSSGTYTLTGSGLLSVAAEYVGYDAGGAALFQQPGGVNQTAYLAIGGSDRYTLTGGTLYLTGSGGLVNQGVFDCSNGSATLLVDSNSIADLSHTSLTNVGAMTVSTSANSLLIVPAGFNPAARLKSFTPGGLTHTAGTTLTVSAGQSFGGRGFIADPVVCQGLIAGSSGGISLTGGLYVSGTGNVNLSGGTLTSNDATSGIASGSITAGYQNVGYSGTGLFTQSGGTNAGGTLALGVSAANSGSYTLTAGLLSASSENVGVSGVGTFLHTGGTNAMSYGLQLGAGTGGNGTYTLNGPALLTCGDGEWIGYSSPGTFNHSAGTNSAHYFYVGFYGAGSYSLGDGVLLTQNEAIGVYASGSFTQTGGTHSNTGPLYLGYDNGGTGTYTLGGSGLVSVDSLFIGEYGSGVFTQSGGTCIAKTLSVGHNYGPGRSGTYNMNGGLLVTSSLNLGVGIGYFNFNAGTLTASASFSTNLPMTLGVTGTGATIDTNGYTLTLSGSLTGPGSLLKLGNGALVLNGSNTYSGSTTVTAGTLQVAGTAALSNYSTPGRVTIANGATLTLRTGTSGWTAAGIDALLAGNGNGFAAGSTLAVDTSGGSLAYSGCLAGNMALAKLGSNGLTLATANAYAGGTTLAAGMLNINHAAALPPGVFTIAGGTLGNTSGGTISLANNNPQSWGANFAFAGPQDLDLGNGAVTLGGSRTVTVNTATLTVGGAIGGSYPLTKAGSGTLTLSGTNTYSGGTTLSAGRLNLNSAAALGGGTLTITGSSTLGNTSGAAISLLSNNPQVWSGNFTFAGPQPLDLGSGTVMLSGNRTVTVGTSTLTVGGPISGSYSLTKAGIGTLMLGGSNTYTGLTTIAAGCLDVDGALVSRVTVGAGGILSGTGSLTSVTVSGSGHLAPGNPVGALTISGSLTLQPHAILDYELDTPATSDAVVMSSGVLNLGSQEFGDFNFTPLAGFGPGQYTLIDAGSISGTLGPNTDGIINGLNASLTAANGDLILTVAPEPSSAALLAIAAVGLVGCTCRRRRDAHPR